MKDLLKEIIITAIIISLIIIALLQFNNIQTIHVIIASYAIGALYFTTRIKALLKI